MTPLPSKWMQALPGLLTVIGAAAGMAGAAGIGIETPAADGGADISTWPVMLAGLTSLVGGVGVQVSNFKTASLAPPIDKDGKESARYTCSIALGQAHREGDKALVDLLSQTVKGKAPVVVNP